MNICEEKVAEYIQYISDELDLDLSIHFSREYRKGLFYDIYGKLKMYNSHYNPYCIYVKRDKAQNHKCLLCQLFVMKKCRNISSFIGVCHAGVREIIYSLNVDGKVAGYISLSGYKKEEYGEENNAYLKDNMPDKELLDVLIYPLKIMIEQMYAELKTVSSEHQETDNDEILSFINNHYVHLTLDDLCKFFHKSKSAISHNFRKNNGITIKSYCNKLKLRDAKILLRKTDMSVTEMALSLGFDDVSYFIKLFKNDTGMTPLKYRNYYFSK